jgi:hypothetical protein
MALPKVAMRSRMFSGVASLCCVCCVCIVYSLDSLDSLMCCECAGSGRDTPATHAPLYCGERC